MTTEVSVVVVNLNGKDFLDDCFESIERQSFPKDRLEIVMVDNGSTDGSVQHVRARWPRVQVAEMGRNTGFAGGHNAGARAAVGDVVAFINNDARAHPEWISEGLTALRSGMDVGAVASKVLTLDGKTIDYGGGASSFYGHAFKLGWEEADEGQCDRAGETFFPSGCAMLMRRDLFLNVGGFDEDFFAFFEDVDLGWRLWVLGYRVLYAPASFVYHRHHGTAVRFGYERERFMLERNALWMILKNYGDDTLRPALPAAAWLAVQRGLEFTTLDPASFDFAHGPHPGPPEEGRVSPLTMAHLLALSEVARTMPETLRKRDRVQAHRKRSDREIAPLFIRPLVPNDRHKDFLELFGFLTNLGGIEKLFGTRSRVLVITADTVSQRMAGPAIRAWEMARYLGRSHDVRLLVRGKADVTPEGFDLDILIKRTLPRHLAWADIVVFQGFILYMYPDVAASGKTLVCDIYDPFHLESLEHMREEESNRRLAIAASDLAVVNEQLQLCDFFICASEKQRDFWLGQLTALGRINPHTYDSDPSMRDFVEVVPFGIPQDSPVHSKNVLKGVVPGIGTTDRVILWGGGIYNWFDPLTVIRAVDQIRDQHPDIRLFFMGMAHPNPDVPAMRMATEALALARELGLEGKHVFFNEDWVPYNERQNYLLESDIGVSCHLHHVETTYSYRTRVLDYFWAVLPVIATKGDALSELVEERALGLTVEPGDVAGFAAALTRLLDDHDLARECRLNVEKLRPELVWEKALQPLNRFCAAPRRAPDRSLPSTLPRLPRLRRREPFRLLTRIRHYRRKGGWRLVATHVRNYLAGKRGPE